MKLNVVSLTPSMESESAANPYLAADGFVNLDKILELQKEVAKAVKVLLKEDPKLKPTQVALKSVSKRGTPYSAAKDKKKDLAYLAKRHMKLAVKPRKSSSVKIMSVLEEYEGLPKALAGKVSKAFAAINSHVKKQPKAAESVKKQRAKASAERTKVFDKSADEIIEMLGLKDANIVRAQGMGGATLHVKLPSGNYITIGGSDATRFKAAKKTASETAGE